MLRPIFLVKSAFWLALVALLAFGIPAADSHGTLTAADLSAPWHAPHPAEPA